MTKKNLKIAVTVALAAAAPWAHGQIRPAYAYPAQPAEGGPASTPLLDTPLFVTPTVGFSAAHDDNLFLSRTTKKASMIYVTSPGFKIDARNPWSVITVTEQSSFAEYGQSPKDNYADHTARATADMAFDDRTFLRLGYDFLHAHEPRGSTDRPIEGYPDRYNLSTPNVTFAYGAPGAEGRIEAYASDGVKRYQNNRDTTAAGDRDTKEYGAAFYWRVMPKTYALVEARETQIDYKITNPSTGKERRYYAGVTWQATAATTGTLKFGALRREFDGGLPEFKGTSWEGLVNWAPLSYSTFDFYTSRQTNEATGLGSFILSSVGGATWNHAWSSQITSGVDVRYQRDQYENFSRTDETKSLGLKVGYKFRRWLTLGAAYTYTKRDSSLNTFEYDKNVYMLTATGSL